MPTSSTVSDVLKLVTAFYVKEGAADDRALYLTLLNSALDEISLHIPEGFDTYWNNDSTDSTYGTLTLSGQTVTFPSDLRNFSRDSVLWNGNQLNLSSIQEMDIAAPEWRGSTGIPSAYIRTINGILLDVEPSGTTDAMLVIYGTGCLPHCVSADDTNPLTYLTLHHQLATVDYIIANLPIEYAKAESDLALKSMMDARANAMRRWERRLPFIVHDLKARARSPLGAI